MAARLSISPSASHSPHPETGLVGDAIATNRCDRATVLESERDRSWLKSGLAIFASRLYLGAVHRALGAEDRIIYRTTTVLSRPDAGSFDWASLQRGLFVRHLRQSAGFTQISYEEWDQKEKPSYVTYCIKGWVPSEVLAAETTRHFHRFECREETANRWSVRADNHVFTLFWANFDMLSEIPTSQRAWLDYFLASEADP